LCRQKEATHDIIIGMVGSNLPGSWPLPINDAASCHGNCPESKSQSRTDCFYNASHLRRVEISPFKTTLKNQDEHHSFLLC
jgi:hypothetical protein